MSAAAHESVTAALAAALGEVQKMGHDSRNAHANYNYTSIDQYLQEVRPVMARHGLSYLSTEACRSVDNGQVVVAYDFTLLHSSGTTLGPMRRTAAVNAKMGSQADGAAQSYALKCWLRATFMLATGEAEGAVGGNVDPDSQPHFKQQPVAKPRTRSNPERDKAFWTAWEAAVEHIGPITDDLPEDKHKAAVKALLLEVGKRLHGVKGLAELTTEQINSVTLELQA